MFDLFHKQETLEMSFKFFVMYTINISDVNENKSKPQLLVVFLSFPFFSRLLLLLLTMFTPVLSKMTLYTKFSN